MSGLVVIALATFKRPKMLAEAIYSLGNLELPRDFEVQCFLCDNDIEQSAKSIFKRFQNELNFPIRYFHEVERGIVHARNRLLNEAFLLDASYLAFFDDDETVDSQWLINLLQTATAYKVSVVSGQVKYHLPNDSPKWLQSRNFYGGDRPKTGTKLRGASTNNVLIDLSFLKERQLRFDTRFNMSGGSDSFLFREIRDYGGVVISCRESIAYERVPISRANENWILKRALKNGYTEIKRARIRKGKLVALSIFLGYGFWLFICNFFGLLISPFSDYSYKVFNRRRPKKIIGMYLALIGREYEEYRIIDGN